MPHGKWSALYYAALEADREWSKELHRLFGRQACNARYDSRGASTPELRSLCNAKLKADLALLDGTRTACQHGDKLAV